MSRFARTFGRLRDEGGCGLFPYLMAGFPDVPTSHALAVAALEAGADGFEIGVPFSDPLADGATMQRLNARALDGGADLDTALDLARVIRAHSPETPVALMSYYNPLRQRGDQRVAAELADLADGVIVPDLPPEESGELGAALQAHSLGLVPFLSPTSPAVRIRTVAALGPLFIYCVALVGVTGARQDLSSTLGEFLGKVRAETSAPLVVGFGIAQPDHVRHAAKLGAAGVIVASALADLVERSTDPVATARAYLAELKHAATAVTT
ncbi:MAG: tryptophan synthase subunit alpha [Chloroflexi bacterium]|nr:tryptophan synthase subunit alpha [Chloroflexota bacterium]